MEELTEPNAYLNSSTLNSEKNLVTANYKCSANLTLVSFTRLLLTYCCRNSIGLLLKVFYRLFKAEVVRFNL